MLLTFNQIHFHCQETHTQGWHLRRANENNRIRNNKAYIHYVRRSLLQLYEIRYFRRLAHTVTILKQLFYFVHETTAQKSHIMNKPAETGSQLNDWNFR